MADKFYQCALGASLPKDVTKAGSTSAGTPVELRITYDATAASKELVLNALQAIREKIITDNFPPS